MYMLMVVDIACVVIVDQFSHLVSFVVSIIMLVSGYIAQLCSAIPLCSLGLCNCLHMCLKIKFNNNNTTKRLCSHEHDMMQGDEI